MSGLPAPRRIIATHAPDGSVATYDDEVPTVALPGGFAVSVGFVQPSYESDPATAVAEGKDATVAGIVTLGGINCRWIDIGPHTETMAHFTQSLDYVVVTHGTLRLKFHDGSHKDVKVGDVIIQVANIHQWVNISDEPARFFAVLVSSKPTLIDGKGLEEGPLKGKKF